MAKWIIDYKSLKRFLNAEFHIVFEYADCKYALGMIGGRPIGQYYLINLETGLRQSCFLFKNLWTKFTFSNNKKMYEGWSDSIIIKNHKGKMLEEEILYLTETVDQKGEKDGHTAI